MLARRDTRIEASILPERKGKLLSSGITCLTVSFSFTLSTNTSSTSNRTTCFSLQMSARLSATKIYLERLKIVQSVEAAFALDVFLLQVIYILVQYFSNGLL